ncbi:MAG: cysteine desulfurase [Gammaproteobacteria bacterium]|nr:cysteine desulfurase [Gammaproteobacteria bacterium]
MIYFDHNATTPIDEQVFSAMEPYLKSGFGNASGSHYLAREAHRALDIAREQIAELVNAHPSQVIFTSGGTEANNLAIKGSVLGMGLKHVYYGASEHPSVRDVARYVHEKHWAESQPLPVEPEGNVSVDTFSSLVSPDSLVSLMWANNETGVLNDVVALAARNKVVFHSDAVQAAGKLTIDFPASGVDMISLSSHKLYGPKGAGALVAKKSLLLDPLIHGGGQEKGLRSGTENIAAIVGFGEAARLARSRIGEQESVKAIRDALESRLSEISGVTVFCQAVERLPNTTFFAVAGIDGETLIMQLDQLGFAVASGSACSSRSGKPSHVLLAMGVNEDVARGAIRVSLGRKNTLSEINAFVDSLSKVITDLKRMSVVAPC